MVIQLFLEQFKYFNFFKLLIFIFGVKILNYYNYNEILFNLFKIPILYNQYSLNYYMNIQDMLNFFNLYNSDY
jgi:hypothetical protein